MTTTPNPESAATFSALERLQARQIAALEAEIERLQRANEKLRQQVRGIGGS